MKNEDIENLQKIAKSFWQLNSKIKLLVLLDKAKQAYDENNYEKCISTCKKILKNDSENSSALRGLGCAMQNMGNLKKAEEYYLKALKFSKNKEIEYTLLGTLYYNQNELEKAIEFYNKAIDTNDNYEQAFEGRNQSMLEKHIQIVDLQDDLIKRKLF